MTPESLDEYLKYFSRAAEKVERELRCEVVVNRAIAEETIRLAINGYGSIPGIPNPNEFKVAGYLMYWVRKLKPFRVFNLGTVVDILDKEGVRHPFQVSKAPNESVPESIERLRMFVNEMAAFYIAIGIIKKEGVPIKPRDVVVHDLIVALRYHTFSPEAVRAILEVMAYSSIPAAAGA